MKNKYFRETVADLTNASWDLNISQNKLQKEKKYLYFAQDI